MSNKPLSVVAIELGDTATDRLNGWRQTLALLAASGLGNTAELDPLGQELRGAAAVAALAEMERLLRELLVATASEVNSATVRLCDLVPSLRGLATQTNFQAIAASAKSDQHWEGRRTVTTLEVNEEIARLPLRSGSTPQPPLDGRTVRSAHVQRIWAILSLPYEAIPSADLETSLNALSTLRNDVAHGNVPLSEVFHPDVPGKSASEIETHVGNVERLIDHICLAFSEYGASRMYRQSP